ncbi:MAG: hypothetical protein BM565_02630 [Gammaproteobacteria bacterium MedPE]|nr:MAG: hypothetical protein BM565_02630 [Gammaproteobacteria bacterium MedPE]
MKINSLAPAEHQKLKNDKAAVAADKTDSSSESKSVHEKKDFLSTDNNRLLIGAKSLMSALNKELKLGGKLEFHSSINESVSIKLEGGSILDKIDIEPISFDFEEVAKNVMDFVGKAISGARDAGASDDKLAEMFAQAREGVDMGFEQARQELGDMDMLTDDVKEGMDRSYGLIQEGIDGLEADIFNKPTASAIPNVIARELGLQESEQGSISIKTRDGDDINISFGSTTTLAQSQSSTDNGYSSETSYSRSQSFSIEVNGDLDDDELKAINSLVEDISGLADEFFNGDVQKAFEQASELGFDADQIAQFSLDFKEVKQVAVREHYAPGQTASPIATLAPYVKDLNDVMESGESLFAKDNLKQLMQDIAQQQVDALDDMLNKSAIDFTNFNQKLIDAQEK